MLALHSAEAFDRVSKSLFRIEWTSATDSGWGTAFAIRRLRINKLLVLATAKHVVEVALNEPVEWLIQQYDERGKIIREIRYSLTPDEAKTKVYFHLKMDLGILIVPRAGADGQQFSPDDEQPLFTLPEKFRLTPGTRVGWAGFPSIVHDLLSHHQPCYCEGVVAATVDQPSRRLYVVDGHNAGGISGGPVWHWSDERDRLEIAAVVSGYQPGGEFPGFCVFAPLESFEALFESWQKQWDAREDQGQGGVQTTASDVTPITRAKSMQIWELKPTNVESDHWQGSTYKGEVIVRAEDEDEARRHALVTFRVPTARVPRADTPFPPWTQSELVTCERLDDSDYAEDGPAGVLSPETPGD